jgi:hypothetical protein
MLVFGFFFIMEEKGLFCVWYPSTMLTHGLMMGGSIQFKKTNCTVLIQKTSMLSAWVGFFCFAMFVYFFCFSSHGLSLYCSNFTIIFVGL